MQYLTIYLCTVYDDSSAYGFSPYCTLTNDSKENIEALANLAVAETNLAYEKSGVKTQLNLVHIYRHPTYDKDSNGLVTMLNDISGGSITDVHSNRGKYGADLVAMISGGYTACGIGWIGPHIDYMFSISHWSCTTGYFSFGHEIGHNLGLYHDRGTHNMCTSPGYNFGYRDKGAYFRTILAYRCTQNQCDENIGGDCPRIPRVSSLLT